jgi:hypothetical protein
MFIRTRHIFQCYRYVLKRISRLVITKITAICQGEKQAIYQTAQLEIIVVFLFNSISMVNDKKKRILSCLVTLYMFFDRKSLDNSRRTAKKKKRNGDHHMSMQKKKPRNTQAKRTDYEYSQLCR